MSSVLLVNFTRKAAKANSIGEAPIYVRITINGDRTEFSTRKSIDEKKWDSNSGSARGRTEDVKALNYHLLQVKSRLSELYDQMRASGARVSSIDLKNKYLGKGEREMTILEAFGLHNQEMKLMIGIKFKMSTYKRFEITFRHLQQFILLKYRKKDLPLAVLDHRFVLSLETFFLTNRRCCINTTAKYLENIKKVINLCLSNEWITKNPFGRYRVKKTEVTKEYLTMDEISAIEKKEFGVERLERVRDIFLFSCFTGLAYIDVKTLTQDNIVTGIDGKYWIEISRTKTGTPAKIPLFAQAEAILSKYKDHPVCHANCILLPVLSNQKMNGYLKEIADLCGIKKKITFHLARHTFATTVLLGNGVPIETVSKVLGHKSILQTQHYAKVSTFKIDQDTSHVSEKLSAVMTSSFTLQKKVQ